MLDLFADLRPALRTLRQPRFTFGVLLTLALGIGANVAVFSVVNAVLLKPLPYRDPTSLALIWSRWTNFEKTWLSDQEYFGYRAQTGLFRDVAAWLAGAEASLTGGQAPENVETVAVTRNLFDVLGVHPLRGRGFDAGEDMPNGQAVVLVGYDLWQRRFGGDPDLVGRTIQIDGVGSTVVGILPRSFRLPLEFQSRAAAQLVTPLRLDPVNTSTNHGYHAVARLAPGVEVDRVNRELAGLAARWTAEGRYPVDLRFGAFAVPVPDEVGGSARASLLILVGAVSLLLLITCANVANLLLARSDAQAREMTVRRALGAGRRHLLRRAVTESLVLSFVGGAIGLILGGAVVRVVTAIAPTSVPRAGEIGLDGTVVAFAVLLSTVTGIGFGILTASRVPDANLITGLKEGGRAGHSGSQLRGRALLVTAEMALAVMLVIGATLMAKSFRNLVNLDPGFDPGSALTVRLSLSPAKYPNPTDVARFFERLATDVRPLPGVQAAGLVRVLPLAEVMGDAGLTIEGKPAGSAGRSADWQVVTPGYFEAQGLRVTEGRAFGSVDTPDGLQVIAINQALADDYFPGESPLGQRIRIGPSTAPWRTIVGLVANTRHHGLLGPIKRVWFVPHNQFANSWGSTPRAMTLVVRTAGNPTGLVDPIRRVVAARDPEVPLSRIFTQQEVLAGAVQGPRFTTSLMAGLALLALFLAAIGTYAVVSYSAGQRTREIGIRLALGADRGAVRRLVLRQGMISAGAGVTVGVAGAALLSGFLSTLLYGVSPLDPGTFVLIPTSLLAVALAATLIPALRATRVDPVVALRQD